MTDQTIPADKVRKIIASYRDGASGQGGMILAELKALLPAPPRPTLADMCDEERAECQWMQADVETWGRAVIVLPNAGGGRAMTLNRLGHMAYEDHADVTPRPDLPRMEWPGTDQKADTPDAVPPNTLTVGSEWNDADKLSRACDASGLDQIVVTDKDSDASVWGQNAGWWEGSIPAVGYEPFTILHTGKKADQ